MSLISSLIIFYSTNLLRRRDLCRFYSRTVSWFISSKAELSGLFLSTILLVMYELIFCNIPSFHLRVYLIFLSVIGEKQKNSRRSDDRINGWSAVFAPSWHFCFQHFCHTDVFDTSPQIKEPELSQPTGPWRWPALVWCLKALHCSWTNSTTNHLHSEEKESLSVVTWLQLWLPKMTQPAIGFRGATGQYWY